MKKYKKYIIIIISLLVILGIALLIIRITSKKDEVIKIQYEGNDIYYSDAYFKHSSTIYDEHLATLSMLLSKSSVRTDFPDNIDDTSWYENQYIVAKDFFEVIGFKEFAYNEDYTKRSSFDSIGLAAANKKIDDYTVIGLVVRSGRYFLEWGNNAYLGDGTKSDYMHEGWYNASLKLIDYLNEYILNNNIKGKIKLWLFGYSRGGSVVNIAAGLLDNRIANNELFLANNIQIHKNDLFAYTIESPMGANINSKTVLDPKNEIYNNIWNLIYPNDLIPKIALSEWGFTRFGNDIIIGKADDELNNTVDIILNEIAKTIGSRDEYATKYQDDLKNLITKVMTDDDNENIRNELSNKISSIIKEVISGNKNIIQIVTNNLTDLNNKLIPNVAIPVIVRLTSKISINNVRELSGIFEYHQPAFILDIIKSQDSYYSENM